ncbi:DUF6083 domain-containing protein [Streptomyces sp. NPDC048644]|uniref:DUF6083 domain-containing protein n=1 Tax=Streptomyces sp. NPDC048644 TaxID=3365582 RepID=UPI0037232C88
MNAIPGRSGPARPVSARQQLLSASVVAPVDRPAPRAGHWPAERGRSARCRDCQGLVQQYPLRERGWVVLDAAVLPARMIPPALRWEVDEDGVAARLPVWSTAADARVAHTETCLAAGAARSAWAMLAARPRPLLPGVPEEAGEPAVVPSVAVRASASREAVVSGIGCPECEVPAGVPCRRSAGYRTPRRRPHAERKAAWAAVDRR